MNKALQEAVDALASRYSGEPSEFRGETRMLVDVEHLVDALRTLRDEFGFEMLTDMTGVDYWPQMAPRFHVVYQMRSISKNLILSTEFDRYVLEHPEFAMKIPENAQVVLLPEDDLELRQKNIEIAKAQRESGQPVVYVEIEKVAPQMSRLVNPVLRTDAA